MEMTLQRENEQMAASNTGANYSPGKNRNKCKGDRELTASKCVGKIFKSLSKLSPPWVWAGTPWGDIGQTLQFFLIPLGCVCELLPKDPAQPGLWNVVIFCPMF